MPILPPNTDLTSRDFDSIRVRLTELLSSVFPQWSDFDTAAFGNILVEMYAFVGDVICYYLDNQARESRLSTATQRKNVIALARMFGYKLHGAQAATAEVVFSLKTSAVADVVIPAGTVVRTKEITEPVEFQLLSQITIPAGSSPPQAVGVVERSKTYVQLFDSTNLANQDIVLDYTPYLDDSIVIIANNGLYAERDSLLNAGANDRHFVVLVDQNDRATLRFGNGANGQIPSGGISVTYETGGGVEGNVEAGRINVIEGAFSDNNGNPVQVTVTNPEPASGGTDRQSIESARLLVPESLRATTTTVNREAFEINARRVPGVARALMLTSNEDPTIAENSGILFVVPKGGGLPTQALKDAVLNEVTVVRPCTLTFNVDVQNPNYKMVNIEVRVYLKKGYDKTAVREQIKLNLQEWFRISNPDVTPNENVNWGFYSNGEIAVSDVFNVIRDTDGVRKIGDKYGDLKLNGLPSDVNLKINEFPTLGPSVKILDGDTGQVV